MEKQIKEVIAIEGQTLAVHHSSTTKPLLKVLPHEEVELTPEEMEEVLSKAKRAKAIRLREQAYWDKVNTPKVYQKLDKGELWKYVISRGKELVNGFQLDDQAKTVLAILNLYFAHDESFVEKTTQYTESIQKNSGLHFSLDKGILLFGPVGCGKTTLMRLFSVNPNNSFSIVSCRKVAADYAKKDGGEQLIEESYCGTVPVYAHQYFGQTEIGTCFDDLGTEQNKAHFSNRLNVMEYVLLNRYDNHHLKGKTHVTTNLTIGQIEEEYGERVKSRMMEMFNFILFEPEAADRRR